MLIRFEVANYRSIDQAVELSMVAIDRDRAEVRPEPHLGESLLTVAAIYGPNASGKSNVVSALAWLRGAVRDSVRLWSGQRIPAEQFAFGDGSSGTSEFALELAVDGIRFEYLLEFDPARVHYEGLFHYPEKKRRRIFEREGKELKLQRGLGNLSGTRELLTDRSLALSIARRFDEPLVAGFVDEFLRMQTFGIQEIGLAEQLWRASFGEQDGNGGYETWRWFADQGTPSPASPNRQQALAMLRLADLGIDDVEVTTEEELPLGMGRVSPGPSVQLLHKADGQRIPLGIAAESRGTLAWFRMIGPVLEALRGGSIIVFDELDASLHPSLSAELIRIFHSPETNPRNAQLIFTSHDTSLLNHLNRDEVWLTEKREDGSTRLGALADFAGERVRKSQNLESAYLHGRFGALPQVDQTPLLQALGST